MGTCFTLLQRNLNDILQKIHLNEHSYIKTILVKQGLKYLRTFLINLLKFGIHQVSYCIYQTLLAFKKWET